MVFRTKDGKWRAAVVEVVRIHKQGRPVLVGTTSVEQSELISEKLTEAGIKHSVSVHRCVPVLLFCFWSSDK